MGRTTDPALAWGTAAQLVWLRAEEWGQMLGETTAANLAPTRAGLRVDLKVDGKDATRDSKMDVSKAVYWAE